MIILKKISLLGRILPNKKTLHKFGNEILKNPSELKIGQYKGDNGYYLLYIDCNGNEITDTYHETINQAFEQASYEFNIKNDEWY